jgi:hypothetical protein
VARPRRERTRPRRPRWRQRWAANAASSARSSANADGRTAVICSSVDVGHERRERLGRIAPTAAAASACCALPEGAAGRRSRARPPADRRGWKAGGATFRADGGRQEVEVLEVARPVVEALVAPRGVVVHRLVADARPPVGRAGPPAPWCSGGTPRPCRAADHRQLLLVLARLGEHAQVEQGPGAALVVHDHEGVVQDVGHLAVVGLVEVVHVLAARCQHPHRPVVAGDVVHEVEEVAALLHQRAAGVAVEPVPVAHLARNGKRCSRMATMVGGPRCRRGPPRAGAPPAACSGTRGPPRSPRAPRRPRRRGEHGVGSRPPWCTAASPPARGGRGAARRRAPRGASCSAWRPTTRHQARGQQLPVVGRTRRSAAALVGRHRASRLGRWGRRWPSRRAPGTWCRFQRCSTPIIPVPMIP